MGGSDSLVLDERRDQIAILTLNRPEARNAQNGALLTSLDQKLTRAAADDGVAVIILRAAGEHFSAGHDIGKGRDADTSFPRRTLWPDHVGRSGIEARLYRESDLYLELTRRWRELPKPMIAAVQGACVGAGLMLAWACDLIVAADDAFFSDPVLKMGAPGVEFFAHPWQLPPRIAKEMLFLGDRIDAARAYQIGMVNRVVARAELESTTIELAGRISAMPRLALTLAKLSVNHAEDQMGLRTGMDYAFLAHQLAHAHSEQTAGHATLNMTVAAMKRGGAESGSSE